MKRQHTHTNWALLLRGQFFNTSRAQIQLPTEIELSSSLIKNLFDGPAFFFMLLAVFVLTILVAIPNALAPVALLEGITLLSASRTQQLGRGGPTFRIGFGIILLPFHRR